MSVQNAFIDSHNSKAIDVYKKKLKAQKMQNYSNSPLRDHKVEPQKYTPHLKPSLDLQNRLHRAGQEGDSPKNKQNLLKSDEIVLYQESSSKTLESMLNNCCVLVNIKQFEQKNQNRTFNNMSLTNDGLSMARAGSTRVIQEEPESAKRIVSASKADKSIDTKHKSSHMDDIILKHNEIYKRNRSSSAKRYPEKPMTADVSGRKIALVDKGLLMGIGTKTDLEKVKKKGQLLTSFKEMINKNPFKNFGKKKSTEMKEMMYDCDCENERRFKKVTWESTTSCVRSIGWLRNKYSPADAHIELKEIFEAKISTSPATLHMKDQISKDVTRTFNSNRYLSQEGVKKRMERLLECIAITYPHTGYVQGMNYIAGTLLFHCDEYTSLGVVKILFEELELKDMFLPSRRICNSELPGLGRHIGVIDTLILLELQEIYEPLSKYKISAEYFCTDWLMCLGLNIIPLDYSV